ncbi:MAG: hypothetical protein GEV05_04040 [Betaproteobacteria bacterium]|nr:hypothetical protein [Betaproteobacteria bacterium]
MTKILLIVAVIAVVYFVMRGYARSLAAKPPANSPGRDDDMVRCRHCDVHLPRGESVRAGSYFYCSEEHQKLHGP